MSKEQNEPAVLGQAQQQVRPGAEASWYCLSRDGLATLCKDAADAKETAGQCDKSWPAGGPYRAVLLVDAVEIAWLRHELAKSGKLAEDRLQQIKDDRAQALRWRDVPQRSEIMAEHWMTTGLIGANASFQRAAREYAEEYAAMAVDAERARCAALCESKSNNGNWRVDNRHECASLIRGELG